MRPSRLIHTYHARSMPRHWSAPTMPFWKRLLKATAQHCRGAAWARHGMCELTSTVKRRPVCDLHRFGYFLLPRGVPRSLSSESETETQLASVHPSNVCRGRGEADYFSASTWVLGGNAVAQWLRCCATNRKVAGSIPVVSLEFSLT